MKAKSSVSKNADVPVECAPQHSPLSESQLYRHYNLSVIALKILRDRADEGDVACAQALRDASVTLMSTVGSLVVEPSVSGRTEILHDADEKSQVF